MQQPTPHGTVVAYKPTTDSAKVPEVAIVEAALTSYNSRSTQGSASSSRSNIRRYFKIAVLTIILISILASATVPFISKIQLADSIGGALAHQWQSLAQRSLGDLGNSTMTVAASAPSEA